MTWPCSEDSREALEVQGDGLHRQISIGIAISDDAVRPVNARLGVAQHQPRNHALRNPGRRTHHETAFGCVRALQHQIARTAGVVDLDVAGEVEGQPQVALDLADPDTEVRIDAAPPLRATTSSATLKADARRLTTVPIGRPSSLANWPHGQAEEVAHAQHAEAPQRRETPRRRRSGRCSENLLPGRR